jgi:hypothetical protein
MSAPRSLQDLLPSEAAFAAAMWKLSFGRFEYLQIRGGELILNPWPTAIRAVKFATDPNSAELPKPHSALRPQIAEFFAYVRDVNGGEIRELAVRHGLPFSMEIELPGGRLRAGSGGRRE